MESEEILLAEVPTLGGLYAAGARHSVRVMRQQKREGHVGKLPAVVHEVTGVRFDAAQLTAYQHLLGEPGVDAAPPGFVHVAAFPVAMSVLVRADFPLPLMGMVHISNRVTQFAPIALGEEFSVRAWAQDLRGHRRGALVDVCAEVRVSGELRWRGVSTYLAKGISVPFADQSGVRNGENGSDFELPAQSGLWRLPAALGREYGAVSGDRNPIHLSALSAKVLGFPRAIAHGMYTAARALAVIGPERGVSFVWHVDFAKPVLLPGTVAFGAERVAGGDEAERAAGGVGEFSGSEAGLDATLASDSGWRYAGWHPKKQRVHFTGWIIRRD